MSVFQTSDWESNAISDKVCNQFFKLNSSKKKTNKKKSKVIKTEIDQRKESLKKSKTKKINKRKKLLQSEEDVNKIEPNSLNDDKKTKFKSKLKKNKKKENEIEAQNKQTTKSKKDLKQNSNIDSDKINNIKNNNQQESTNESKKQRIENKLEPHPIKLKYKNLSLRERMLYRLNAARFRYVNEQIYTINSKEAQKIFEQDPDAFKAYHKGYRQQVNIWPLNPLDVIIKNIKKMPKNSIIADFGCGEAKLARSVKQKVYSFDLVAINDTVTACDMANVPLDNNSVDIVVFCLSLMGTNLHDYLLEANRVLKVGGILKIAEIESRFDDIKSFIEAVQRFHFKNIWKDLTHSLFYFLDFKKESNIKNRKNLPTVSLNPCLYKKR